MHDHTPSDYAREPLELPLDQVGRDRPHPSGEPRPAELRDASAFAMIRRLILPAKKVLRPKTQPTRKHESIERESLSPPMPEPRERQRTPRRRKRGQESSPAIGIPLRPEEFRLLAEVGRFRIIAVTDLEKEIYQGNRHQLQRDLNFLKQNSLIERHFLNMRRDGRSADVRRFKAVTLTDTAKKMLIASGQIAEGQRIYSGLVKPSEAEHDAQVFRAYLKEVPQIERAGGLNLRIRLDFELQAKLSRALYRVRKAEPDRDPKEVKVEIARLFQLKVQNQKVVLPDARLEYDIPGGGSAHMDIEVATSAYRHDHLAAKAKAGFKLYISDGDAGRLGAAVLDDHDLMSEILNL